MDISNNSQNESIDNNVIQTKINSPLNEINIKGYKYKYKDTYKKGFCYRCIHRYICKLTILIYFDEYNKLIDNDKNATIKYEVNSKQKTHTCNSNNNIIEEVEKKDVLTKEEEFQLAKMLIKANKKNHQLFILII